MKVRSALMAGMLLLGLAGAWPVGRAAVSGRDADGDRRDSPGDELRLANEVLELRFAFVDAAGDRAGARARGWRLDSITYQGEKFFQHPAPEQARALYPSMLADDAIGMSAFTRGSTYRDDPFLWLWNAREPRRSLGPLTRFAPVNAESYEWYTLYERHEEREGGLTFISGKNAGLREEMTLSLDGPELTIGYRAISTSPLPFSLTGIIALPMNRILDTVFTPPDLTVTRKLAPVAFSDHYVCRLTSADALAGSGMLFWARAKNSLLHMDGLLAWSSFAVAPGEAVSREAKVRFLDQDIDQYYRDYLATAGIGFDRIDWDATEQQLAAMVPAVIMPEGYIYHTYNYNPPGTNRDWHNEMTGRALIIRHLQTGGREWLDYATRANQYYLDRMYFNASGSPCYGYFRDQTWADKLTDCYPWSQPYNSESLIAEYAVTRDERLREVLRTHFEKMYSGPLWNDAGRRWYWRLSPLTGPEDFGVFDSVEFGADDMISAYEFTGEARYLERAVEVVNGSRHALDNFGLLLEDRAGESSVNTTAFAAKLLFKLYEYTGDGYWHDRAVRILNATLYSRVLMEPYAPEDTWLKGALARKDGDWRGQFGPPTTGTDSSVPSQTSFIPWVEEALVAGYNHTGNPMYLDYMGQLLHHQIEANHRLAAATDGKAIACGHYNMYSREFQKDNDGLTVVSNLFLFPYVKVFERGVRSPHSSVVLMPGPTADTIRAFHLSGRQENVTVVLSPGVSISAVAAADNDGRPLGVIPFTVAGNVATFAAAPDQMYLLVLPPAGKD
jgi:hypothetical protein